VRSTEPRILNLEPPPHLKGALQEQNLALLARLNRDHLARHPGEADLEARIASYELAARMQTAAKEALDLAGESEATKKLYGLDDPVTREYGSRCLIARRLVERGVRFVQIYHGGGHQQQNWDAHNGVEENLKIHCPEIDKPISALLGDLEQRGLLEQTLVIWGGEFGRQPVSQGDHGGRDHNPKGFTYFLAGGGVKGGTAYGETDELGHEAVTDKHHIRDLHATVLHLMGLDYRKLTYFYGGLNQKLTGVVEPQIIRKII